MEYSEVFKSSVIEATKAVVAQGCQSMGVAPNGEVCLYRGPNGAKCFIGHMIKDSQYHETMEGEGIDDYEVEKAVSKSLGLEGLRMEETDLLGTVQSIHDNCCSKDFSEEFEGEIESHVESGDLPSWVMEYRV